MAPALVLLLLTAACSGSSGPAGPTATPVAPTDGALTVRSFEWGYDPEVIVLQRGDQVRILLDNTGTIIHNWKVDDLAADVIESVSTGPLSGKEGQIFVGADAGRQGTLTFVPQETGIFTYFCTIEGHLLFGMEGTLIVE